MTKKCVHDKVYQNKVLTSDPPRQRWICSKCGTTGIDTIRMTIDNNMSYQELLDFYIKKNLERKHDE